MQKTGRKKNIFEIRESEIRQIFPEKKKRILFFFGGGLKPQATLTTMVKMVPLSLSLSLSLSHSLSLSTWVQVERLCVYLPFLF